MKVKNLIYTLALVFSIVFANCKSEAKKEESKEVKENTIAKAETVSLNLSGMSCEIGCAKNIESKLAKKEGVIDAKVVFNDSLATIQYDGNKLNQKDLIAFVEGIGDGHSYKASLATKKDCKEDCKKESCDSKKAKVCKEECSKNKGDKKDCKKESATTKKA